MAVRRRRYAWWLCVSVGLLCGAPWEACANMVVPSIVQVIAAPFPLSVLAFYYLPIACLVLLVVSLIEAAVVRKAAEVPFRNLLVIVASINALTSAAGWLMGPDASNLWPGILWAYALTAVLEGGLLLLPGILRSRRLLKAFGLSFGMNAVTYVLIAAVLYPMLLGPYQRTRDQAILTRLSGRLVSDRGEGVVLSKGAASLSRRGMISPQLRQRQRSSVNYIAISPDLTAGLVWRPSGTEVSEIASGRVIWRWSDPVDQLPPPCISDRGRVVAYRSAVNGAISVVDTCNHTVRALKDSAHVRALAVCADGSKLALCMNDSIALVDVATLRRTNLAMKQQAPFLSRAAWSPDGRYLSVAGSFNPYTASNLLSVDITVIDSRTREWARLPFRVGWEWTQAELVWVR